MHLVDLNPIQLDSISGCEYIPDGRKGAGVSSLPMKDTHHAYTVIYYTTIRLCVGKKISLPISNTQVENPGPAPRLTSRSGEDVCADSPKEIRPYVLPFGDSLR